MPVSSATRALVRRRANRHCEYCHADERWQVVLFTLDHVLPESRGGDDTPDNLGLACRNCNERRGNRQTAEDPQTGTLVPVFNPRVDTWAEHFAWSADRLRIVGLTPTARATAALLDLNDDHHGGRVLLVRERDLQDGFHPPEEDPVLPK